MPSARKAKRGGKRRVGREEKKEIIRGGDVDSAEAKNAPHFRHFHHCGRSCKVRGNRGKSWTREEALEAVGVQGFGRLLSIFN